DQRALQAAYNEPHAGLQCGAPGSGRQNVAKRKPVKCRTPDTVPPKLLSGLVVPRSSGAPAMIFTLFAALIAAAFFVSSLFLLNYGRQLGLRYLKGGTSNMAGLATVEGAVFALIGLLLAFTISGALQRFDDRRQLVIQEANAASTAHDRLALFG